MTTYIKPVNQHLFIQFTSHSLFITRMVIAVFFKVNGWYINRLYYLKNMFSRWASMTPELCYTFTYEHTTNRRFAQLKHSHCNVAHPNKRLR